MVFVLVGTVVRDAVDVDAVLAAVPGHRSYDGVGIGDDLVPGIEGLQPLTEKGNDKDHRACDSANDDQRPELALMAAVEISSGDIILRSII